MNGIAGLAGGPLPVAAGRDGDPARDPSGPGDRETIAAAWERFVGGDDSVRGVRPEILLSWYRCREEYKVDPGLTRAPAAGEEDAHRLEHDVVFTVLGGLAARAAAEAEALDGVLTVSDAHGRILASWGEAGALRDAEASNLAPWAAWPESAAGTNGLGTALFSHHPVCVRGPEHWCRGFHAWSCAGVAVRDVVTDEPLAVLNISRHGAGLPGAAQQWLRTAAATVRQELVRRARRGDAALTADPGAPAPLAAAADVPGRRMLADRIAGRRGNRLILLPLQEVRFAEAAGAAIWLVSDQGRLQAVTRGLDNLERDLEGEGFFRVHRRYLVNLRRVREIEAGFKGTLFAITDARSHEVVPVSRRHAVQLRQALGLVLKSR